MTDATVTLPDEFIEQVAQRVAAILAERDTGSPWMSRAQAAEYMAVPLSRLEKDKTVPCHRWDGRLLYDRRELDEFLRHDANWTSKP